jgi:hypothetical protein
MVITGPVSQVLLEAPFLSRLTALSFQGDALSNSYIQGLAPNSAPLSHLQSLRTLYIKIIRVEHPLLEGEVICKITYNLEALLTKVRSPSLSAFVFRLDSTAVTSVYRAIVRFLRAHRQTLRTLILPTGLNFTAGNPGEKSSVPEENEPIQLRLRSLSYNDLYQQGGGGGGGAWPPALSRLNWHGLQELNLETHRSLQEVSQNLLGPNVFATLKYLSLSLSFSPVIDLGLFSASHSLQFLYLFFFSGDEEGNLINFNLLPTSLRILSLGLSSRTRFHGLEGLSLPNYPNLISLELCNGSIPNYEVLLHLLTSTLHLRKLCSLSLRMHVQSLADQESHCRLQELENDLFPPLNPNPYHSLEEGSVHWKLRPGGVENLEDLCSFVTTQEVLEAKYDTEDGKERRRIKPIAIESLQIHEIVAD